jgi:hypothetical protein
MDFSYGNTIEVYVKYATSSMLYALSVQNRSITTQGRYKTINWLRGFEKGQICL